eukprot:358899-Rhodomonas_salina.1
MLPDRRQRRKSVVRRRVSANAQIDMAHLLSSMWKVSSSCLRKPHLLLAPPAQSLVEPSLAEPSAAEPFAAEPPEPVRPPAGPFVPEAGLAGPSLLVRLGRWSATDNLHRFASPAHHALRPRQLDSFS